MECGSSCSGSICFREYSNLINTENTNQTSPLAIFTLHSCCSPQSCFNQHVLSLRLEDILIRLLGVSYHHRSSRSHVYTTMALRHSRPCQPEVSVPATRPQYVDEGAIRLRRPNLDGLSMFFLTSSTKIRPNKGRDRPKQRSPRVACRLSKLVYMLLEAVSMSVTLDCVPPRRPQLCKRSDA